MRDKLVVCACVCAAQTRVQTIIPLSFMRVCLEIVLEWQPCLHAKSHVTRAWYITLKGVHGSPPCKPMVDLDWVEAVLVPVAARDLSRHPAGSGWGVAWETDRGRVGGGGSFLVSLARHANEGGCNFGLECTQHPLPCVCVCVCVCVCPTMLRPSNALAPRLKTIKQWDP